MHMSKKMDTCHSEPSFGPSRSGPSPGDYVWLDRVHLREPPHWSVYSPDRAMLDPMVTHWTPAPTSLQPRAPDPGAYGDIRFVGRNGKYFIPRWSFDRSSTRPCFTPDRPKTNEIELKIPSLIAGRQPIKPTYPLWVMSGKDRKHLPANLPSWTPQTVSDTKPGPGTYTDPRDLARAGGRWKAVTRRGCTWGGRAKSSHQTERP